MLQDGHTALHYAAAKDHLEVIELLVKHGAAVDIRDKVLNFIL
jgi:ankyrin repeat protein